MASPQERLEAVRAGRPDPGPDVPQQAQATSVAKSEPAATPEQREVGLWERFTSNTEDAWKTGTVAGAVTLAGKAAIVGKEKTLADEKKRQAEHAAIRSWNDGPRVQKAIPYSDEMGNSGEYVVESDPNFLKTMAHGGAALTGQLVGNALTPETFIGAPAALSVRAVQAGSKVGKAALGAATQAGANAVSDPIIQGTRTYLGLQNEYDWEATLGNVALGAATGGAFPQLNREAVAMERRNRALQVALGDAKRVVDDFHGKFKIPDDLKGEKYIGSFNTHKTELSEPAYTAIRDAVDGNNQFSEARRLHLAGTEEIKKLADQQGIDPTKYLNHRPGDVYNPEDTWNMRKFHANASEELVTLANLAQTGREEDVIRFMAMNQRYRQIEAASQGARTEWGRTGAIYNEPLESDEKLKALDAIRIKFGGIMGAKQYATLVASLQDPRQVAKFVREAEKGTTGNQLVEAWQSALLSSPDTHIANMLGSTINTVMSVPEKALAAAIGPVRQTLVGGEDGLAMRAALARTMGVMQGARDGLRLAAQAFRTEMASGVQQGDVHHYIPGVAGQVIRTPLRALLAEDTFFKTVNKYMALLELAWDEAIKRKIPADERYMFIRNFVNNPRANIASQAEAMGKYYTFNAELGRLGNAVLSMKEAHPTMAFLMPFVRTPINIIKQGFERTPLGYVVAINNYRKGKISGKELDLAISRATIGSGLAAYMAMEALNGNIVGSGPMNPDQREAIRDTGAEIVSVRQGDQFLQLSRVQPLGMVMGLAADYATQMKREGAMAEASGKRDETGDPTPIMGKKMAEYMVWALMKNMVQGSFVTQLNNVFEGLTAPDRNLERVVETTAASFVPTVVGRVAQGMDPVVRDPQGPGEAMLNRIPGYTHLVQPKLNRMGDERVREAGVLESLFNPIRRTKDKKDFVYDEIARHGITFNDLDKFWHGKKLTPEQYTYLVKNAGQPAKKILDDVLQTDGYKNAPAFMQEEIIRGRVAEFAQTAKDMLVAKWPKELGGEQANLLEHKIKRPQPEQYPFLKR
jgi:hypothetical protein